jgi:hypothetical protein
MEKVKSGKEDIGVPKVNRTYLRNWERRRGNAKNGHQSRFS